MFIHKILFLICLDHEHFACDDLNQKCAFLIMRLLRDRESGRNINGLRRGRFLENNPGMSINARASRGYKRMRTGLQNS